MATTEATTEIAEDLADELAKELSRNRDLTRRLYTLRGEAPPVDHGCVSTEKNSPTRTAAACGPLHMRARSRANAVPCGWQGRALGHG